MARKEEAMYVVEMVYCFYNKLNRSTPINGDEPELAARSSVGKFLFFGFVYFFLAAFSAALVTLPPETSFALTDLMTPTATVCLMSRTAKRPRGGKSV